MQRQGTDMTPVPYKSGFLQTFHSKIHKLFTNFQDDFLPIQGRNWIFYSPLSRVIHVQPSFHSSDAKVLTFHDYNILSAKV